LIIITGREREREIEKTRQDNIIVLSDDHDDAELLEMMMNLGLEDSVDVDS